ncbi:nuclear pore complex protein Nup54-like [Lytechinus variegatus]|uniref:nuclear pore complex protein Nup54-like n=1 Tax=Lytechinus variegatus TaxID=7654 RepID=UPI001BB2C7EE|nr:nuclear pore complex protein Nup54-like [Lytechinus variegatus]
MSFNFGSTSTFGGQNKPSFGGFGSTSTGTSGFSFGSTTKTTAPTLGFGTSTATTTSSSAFGFGIKPIGTATTSTGGGFGFGSGGLGGNTQTTSSASGFNFGTSTSTGGFGAKPGGSSLFGGGGFGQTATSSSSLKFGFGGLNTGTTTTSGLGTGFGAQPQQQQQQQQLGVDNNLVLLAAALSVPSIYGDERDNLLAKWNQLQAFWGTGSGFVNQNTTVNFTPENPFCRFKTVGYSVKPTAKTKDGLVVLHFKKKDTEIRAQQQQLVDSLYRIMGSKPTLSVCVEDVRPLPDDKSEVVIYILERLPTGATKRIPSTETFAFLNNAKIKQQLGSLGVVHMQPRQALTQTQLENYLQNPPLGYDPRLWRQAQLDNPDPDRLIPVPLVGFDVIKTRLEYQQQETQQHQARLDLVSKDLEKLQEQQDTLQARIAENKRRHLELSHRVLQVMARQEVQRKQGVSIQLEEEHLRTQLEGLMAELNAPTQMKARLNEMLSQIRLQSHLPFSRNSEQYSIDSDLQYEIRQHLKQQQEGISHLVGIIKEDLEDLKLIERGLEEATS